MYKCQTKLDSFVLKGAQLYAVLSMVKCYCISSRCHTLPATTTLHMHLPYARPKQTPREMDSSAKREMKAMKRHTLID